MVSSTSSGHLILQSRKHNNLRKNSQMQPNSLKVQCKLNIDNLVPMHSFESGRAIFPCLIALGFTQVPTHS